MPQNIRFEEEEFRPRGRSEETPLLIRWVLKTGIVQTKAQAAWGLIGIAVILTGLALIIFFSVLGDEDVPERYHYNEETYNPARDPEEPVS